MTPEKAIAWLIAWIIVFGYVLYLTNKKPQNKWTRPKIKHNKLTKYNWMVSHPERLTLGENTDIGAFTYIQAEHGVTIGKNTQIGSHCSIYSKNTIDNTHGKIAIEDNVKVGSHTIILPIHESTLCIGHDSIIGAHSLIKCSVFPNSTIYGLPVKNQKKLYEHGL